MSDSAGKPYQFRKRLIGWLSLSLVIVIGIFGWYLTNWSIQNWHETYQFVWTVLALVIPVSAMAATWLIVHRE